MPTSYGYNPPGMIKNYECLRRVTLWAGTLGTIQALIWIALTIVGIIAYNALIDIESNFTYGSVMSYIFYDLYFRGPKLPASYDQYDNEVLTLAQKEVILNPDQMLIWDCVYLAAAVCWLLSSVLIITHVQKDSPKSSMIIIDVWVSVTLCICLMDLALGIIFGIDHGRLKEIANDKNLNSAHSGEVDAQNVQWFAAMVTSMSMMVISFKGFSLWIVNFTLVVYLFLKVIAIYRDLDNNNTLFMPRKQSDDVLTSREPINAYDETKLTPRTYTNEAFAPDNRSTTTIELNQDSIIRAARISTDPSLQDRRFRNVDTYQQFPPPRYNREPIQRPESTVPASTSSLAAFPAPDYSPPMSRVAPGQPQNGGVRNQRY